MRLNPYLMRRKHFTKLMMVATLMVLIISGTVYFATGDGLMASAIGICVWISDYIGLKMLIKQTEARYPLPPEDA